MGPIVPQPRPSAAAPAGHRNLSTRFRPRNRVDRFLCLALAEDGEGGGRVPPTIGTVIDLRLVREHPDLVRASQRARGADESLVDVLLAADADRRAAVKAADDLRGEQKA